MVAGAAALVKMIKMENIIDPDEDTFISIF